MSSGRDGGVRRRSWSRRGRGSCGHHSPHLRIQWRTAAQRDGGRGNFAGLIYPYLFIDKGDGGPCRFLRGPSCLLVGTSVGTCVRSIWTQSAPARSYLRQAIQLLRRWAHSAHILHLEISFTVTERSYPDGTRSKRLETTGTHAKRPKNSDTTEDLLAAAVPGPEAAVSEASRRKSGGLGNYCQNGGSELVETRWRRCRWRWHGRHTMLRPSWPGRYSQGYE